ncbi:MAG: MoaD/ThiS family protein [Elusimicrobia bacterium]|jgi:molybdopterin converting factor small subunit|nr:MoaD/ThiS family protein [Elusimicrobiota bacterium]
MKVTLRLIGSLIHCAGFSERVVVLSASATVADALARVKVEKSRPLIVTRNGKAAAPEERLQDGDRVAVAPPYSGG